MAILTISSRIKGSSAAVLPLRLLLLARLIRAAGAAGICAFAVFLDHATGSGCDQQTRAAFMGKGGHGNFPAGANGIKTVLVLYHQVIKNHFIKARLAGQFDQRPNSDTLANRWLDGHHKIGQAVILVGFVCTAEQYHPVGKVRQGSPDLVAIDDPAVTAFLSKGLLVGKVRASAGFTETPGTKFPHLTKGLAARRA